jgi:NAD(P)H-hydrate epimerase
MARAIPAPDRLPHALYRADQVRKFDQIAIEEYRIPGSTLMQRAGAAAFRLLRQIWPEKDSITVVCGVGNNGGDGYVVGRLALQAGLTVKLYQLGDPDRLRGDALAMSRAFADAGGRLERFRELPARTGVLVDAVFGTGLEREVTGAWGAALDRINRHPAPVLSIDIPSGLHSDTGQILGVAVRADASISFIGLKRGMFTGAGPDCCGRVHFDALEVPARIYAREILAARRLDWLAQSKLLRPRRRSAHKGDFGHVLVIGGAPGFGGAVRMAGEAAARCGAGLVSLASHPEHAALIGATRPELMCHGVTGAEQLDVLLERATVVAIGPGLGRSDWAHVLLARGLGGPQPLVVDADALNLLAEHPHRRDNWVLTPHPGEAARLLNESTAWIQEDRFRAARLLQERYGGVCLLKGAGTLIQGPGPRPVGICSEGNPGMASGGMGDILTGIIAGLIAQGIAHGDAADMGVCLHAAAGDRAARDGERGLLATDLLPHLRNLLNRG